MMPLPLKQAIPELFAAFLQTHVDGILVRPHRVDEDYEKPAEADLPYIMVRATEEETPHPGIGAGRLPLAVHLWTDNKGRGPDETVARHEAWMGQIRSGLICLRREAQGRQKAWLGDNEHPRVEFGEAVLLGISPWRRRDQGLAAEFRSRIRVEFFEFTVGAASLPAGTGATLPPEILGEFSAP